jgi:ribosomal protein S13
MTPHRSTREVLDDHLRLAQEWDLEADLERNFSENIVLLTSFGVYRGIEGVWKTFRLLDEQMPGGRWATTG